MAFNLEQVKNLFSSIREKSTAAATAAADKTKDAARIAKLTVDLGSEKGNLEKAYLELGKAFYEERKDSAEGLIAQLCAEVSSVSEKIKSMQAELDSLKDSFKAPEEPDFETVVDQAEPDITVEVTEESPCEDCEKESCEGCEEAPAEKSCCEGEEKAEESCCCEGEEKAEESCCCEDGAKAEESCCCEGEEKAEESCCCEDGEKAGESCCEGEEKPVE